MFWLSFGRNNCSHWPLGQRLKSPSIQFIWDDGSTFDQIIFELYWTLYWNISKLGFVFICLYEVFRRFFYIFCVAVIVLVNSNTCTSIFVVVVVIITSIIQNCERQGIWLSSNNFCRIHYWVRTLNIIRESASFTAPFT